MDTSWRSLAFLTFLAITIILQHCNQGVQGKWLGTSYYLNSSAALEYCSHSGCDFTNPLIWNNSEAPVPGSDVYLIGDEFPPQINIVSEMQLGNLHITGTIDICVNSTFFQVNGEVFTDTNNPQQLELQLVNSTTIFRNMTLNGASVWTVSGTVNVQNLIAINESALVVGNGTIMECGSCSINELSTTHDSVFLGDDVRLVGSSYLSGLANISTLVVESKVTLTDAYLRNVTIMENADIIGSGSLEIGTLNMQELSVLVFINGSIYIGMDGSSYQIGPGAITLSECGDIVIGSENGLIDATSTNIQLWGNNVGYFTNIIFGSFMIMGNEATVELTLTYVTFTQSNNLYANITAYGALKIEKSLSVLGVIKCKQCDIYVYGQLSCNNYSHVEGNLNLWGSLSSPTIISNNSVLSVLGNSQIQGHVRATNSSIILSAPLFVKGVWQSDLATTIQLGDIAPNTDVRLNISSDMVLNGTTFYYAITSVPTSTSIFRLFAYHGTLNGTFQIQATLPANLDTTLLTLDKSTNVIFLTYTAPHHSSPLLSPGPRLWAVLAGFAVFVVLVVLVSLYLIRRRKQRHYEVIES